MAICTINSTRREDNISLCVLIHALNIQRTRFALLKIAIKAIANSFHSSLPPFVCSSRTMRAYA